MRLSAESRDQIAARYVLGTLSDSARQRMEKLMMLDWRVREAVWQWETQLGPLLMLPPPITAPKKLLYRIEQRLFGVSEARSRAPGSWASMVAALSVLALAVTMWLSRPPTVVPAPSFAAMAIEQQGVQWRFSADAGFAQLSVRAIMATDAAPDKDYELWALPSDGAPVSLGVLHASEQEQRLTLSSSQQRALAAGKLLAISLEPAGGSPTGLPTGPVLYTAAFVSI